MTQGNPLQSTVSVLYFMYDEGFTWWSLGRASAIAFLLFALILAATWLLLRWGRRGETRMNGTRWHSVARQRPARAARIVRAVSAALDAVGLVHASGRSEHAAATAAARERDVRELPRAVRARRHGALSRQQPSRRVRDHAALARLQSRGRLRVRETALRRPRPPVPDAADRTRDPGAGRDDSAVPDHEVAAPRQQLRRRRSCRRWRRCSASSSCASTRARFPTSCSKPRASTAPANGASSRRSCCRC